MKRAPGWDQRPTRKFTKKKKKNTTVSMRNVFIKQTELVQENASATGCKRLCHKAESVGKLHSCNEVCNLIFFCV